MVSLFARQLLFSWRPSCSHNAAYGVSSTCVEFLWQWFRIHDVQFRFFFCPEIVAKTRDLSVVFRFFNLVFGTRSPMLDKILSQYSEKATNWTIQSSIREKDKRIFYSSERPDLLWDSPGPTYIGYRCLFRPTWSCRCVRLTAHLHIVCLRMSGIIISSPCVVSWFAQGK